MTNRYPIGTLDLAAIEDAIYDWIKDITQGVLDDVQIVWRNQSQPLPPRPCVTLKFTYGPAPTDRDPNIFLGPPSGPMTFGMQMEANLSIQVFGNTQVNKPMAYQLAVDLNSSLMFDTVRRRLKVAGISIQEVGKPQNMTALEESQYEERAGFELGLGMAQNITDAAEPTGTIETINVQKKVDGETLPVETITEP